MLLETSNNFSVVAAQLVEAACRARDGDCETAKVHIAHAVALLQGQPSTMPTTVRAFRAPQVVRGGFALWQARRLAAFIDANLAGKPRIEQLAGLLGLSVSHFCRAFKCTFSVSAHEYLTRRRIAVAQGLMLTTCDTISEIALNCGMSDQSHFTRSFRRIVGETPCSWRRTRSGAFAEQETTPARSATRRTKCSPLPAPPAAGGSTVTARMGIPSQFRSNLMSRIA